MIGFKEFEPFSNESDPVTRQYDLLPYPPMEENKLNKEEQFYKTNNHINSFHRSHSLENINQYLHRGKDSFR